MLVAPRGTIDWGTNKRESPVIPGNRIQAKPQNQTLMRNTQTIAMQKVVGSSPISRFGEARFQNGFLRF
jgi:hypothetical protein